MNLLQKFQDDKANGLKRLAVLIDPDFSESLNLDKILEKCKISRVDYIFVGGSFLSQNKTNEVIQKIKKKLEKPVIIFPGSCFQISPYADAILFMSLISGRNPDLLIGQQVMAAPILEKFHLDILPTGYMLVEGDYLTTAHYVSNTMPLPKNKPNLAYATALAGKYLGLKLIYMDTGSGASEHVPINTIETVSKIEGLPLIIGGGVTQSETVYKLWEAGADVVVVGTVIENNPDFLEEFS
jgi:putative glycerol-1-phosphate prenyltransferase